MVLLAMASGSLSCAGFPYKCRITVQQLWRGLGRDACSHTGTVGDHMRAQRVSKTVGVQGSPIFGVTGSSACSGGTGGGVSSQESHQRSVKRLPKVPVCSGDKQTVSHADEGRANSSSSFRRLLTGWVASVSGAGQVPVRSEVRTLALWCWDLRRVMQGTLGWGIE